MPYEDVAQQEPANGNDAWYPTIRANYEAVAAALAADGWKIRNKGKHFIEHFTRGDEAVRVVRSLGDWRWRVEYLLKEETK